MLIARTQDHLLAELDVLRKNGHHAPRLSLVILKSPCHDGHGAVINAARTLSDQLLVVLIEDHINTVSNVVTASEFHDIGFIEHHKADMLYVPNETQLYPQGFNASCQTHLPTQVDPEGKYSYYLTTQLKLLNLVQPDVYVCGEKHCELTYFTRKMMHDLGLRSALQSVPIVRHADGAVVSATYAHLSEHQQQQVGLLFATLKDTAHAIKNGARNYPKVEKTARLALREAGFTINRYSILDENTFDHADSDTTKFRIVAETELDGIKLADNFGLAL